MGEDQPATALQVRGAAIVDGRGQALRLRGVNVARPFEIIEGGFRHLDRAVAAGATHGVYTIIDLHALPGFLERSAYARRTGTPLYVGEFAPIYTGDPEVDALRRWILSDQLERYRRYDAGFATWMYKDLGRQGLTYARPDSPYGQLVAEFVAKKVRLGVDQWGSTGRECPEITEPIQELVAREAPDFDPYPWGRFDWVRTLLLNITFAQPLAHEYAELFRGLADDALVALAESFAFANCAVRERLREQLAAA